MIVIKDDLLRALLVFSMDLIFVMDQVDFLKKFLLHWVLQS